MKEEIKEILEALKPHDKEFTEAGIKEYPLVLSLKEQKILLDYITNLQEYYSDIVNKYEDLIVKYSNLQEEKTKIRKILIEHIEEARYELNVILQSDNDLNYKNECSKEFEILNKNIRMILDKIDDILKGDKDD